MPHSRETLIENLARIRGDLRRACERVDRDPAAVRLVAASKTVPIEPIGWAFEEGVTDFGENYVKELVEKRPQLPGARWHFIGNLQSGTARRVADLADVVETLASERSTRRLARRAAERDRELDALIEIDLTGERSGVSPDDLEEFSALVASLEGVRLVGLMTLPPIPTDPEDSRPHFQRLRRLLESLHGHHPGAVELSMGMSMDYEVAAEEGATMVRIGTALFGERPPST
jgi:pyridoxal phosphate enzyme (YggS family)